MNDPQPLHRLFAPAWDDFFQGTDVVVQPDGGIVAAGWAERSFVPAFDAVRYTTGGSRDPTFHDDGIVRVDVSPGADKAFGLALQPDGKLVLVGATAAGGRNEWGVIRLGSRGRLDPTFGVGGKVVTSFGPGYDEADAVTVQANGKLVVAGRIRPGTKDDIGVMRFKPSGRHDRTFGSGGRVFTDVAGGSDTAHDLVIASNGKIVVVGEAAIDRIRRFVVVRYRGT